MVPPLENAKADRKSHLWWKSINIRAIPLRSPNKPLAAKYVHKIKICIFIVIYFSIFLLSDFTLNFPIESYFILSILKYFQFSFTVSQNVTFKYWCIQPYGVIYIIISKFKICKIYISVHPNINLLKITKLSTVAQETNYIIIRDQNNYCLIFSFFLFSSFLFSLLNNYKNTISF